VPLKRAKEFEKTSSHQQNRQEAKLTPVLASFIKPQDANDTAERTENDTTPTPEYWPTIPLPDFNDEDVNVTLQLM